jgi:hypothetical protein
VCYGLAAVLAEVDCGADLLSKILFGPSAVSISCTIARPGLYASLANPSHRRLHMPGESSANGPAVLARCIHMLLPWFKCCSKRGVRVHYPSVLTPFQPFLIKRLLPPISLTKMSMLLSMLTYENVVAIESLRKSRMRLLGAQTHCVRLFFFFRSGDQRVLFDTPSNALEQEKV